MKGPYYEIGEKQLEMSMHIRSLWLNQGHHGSSFLMRGMIGSPPEPSLARVLGFSRRRLSHKEMCMCLA